MATSTTKRKTATRKVTQRKNPTTTATGKPAGVTEKPAPSLASKPVSVPKVVKVADPVVASPELKKKELIDLVVERSGIKKKFAKPVVEAMLAELGETIAKGRELNLQPFGKLRINRSIDKSNGRVIICKLRQSEPAQNRAKDTLAEVPDKL